MRSLSFCLFLLYPAFITAEEVRKVTCRFVTLDATVPTPPLVSISGDGTEVPITVATGSISKETDIFSKTNIFSFLTVADRTPAANVTIPPGVKAAILLFVSMPKAANSMPWRVFVIEDSDKNFPDGGAFVANFHNQDIRFIIGENKLMLKPGGFHGVARPAQRDDFNMAQVAFQFQQGETWRDASESMMRFLPGTRYLMVTYVDPASGRPRITTFQDQSFKSPAPVPASTR